MMLYYEKIAKMFVQPINSYAMFEVTSFIPSFYITLQIDENIIKYTYSKYSGLSDFHTYPPNNEKIFFYNIF